MGFLDKAKKAARQAADQAQSKYRELEDSGKIDEWKSRAEDTIKKAEDGINSALSGDDRSQADPAPGQAPTSPPPSQAPAPPPDTAGPDESPTAAPPGPGQAPADPFPPVAAGDTGGSWMDDVSDAASEDAPGTDEVAEAGSDDAAGEDDDRPPQAPW